MFRAMLAMRLTSLISFAFFVAHMLLVGNAEIISDIITSSLDENRALEIKADQFWLSVLQVAEDMKMDEHVALYQDVEMVVGELPAENVQVRQLLLEALARLRSADELVLVQAAQASELASDRLAAPTGDGGLFSFLTGGQNFLSIALRRFVDGSSYSSRLVHHVEQRLADVLPVLRGTATITGNVLSDCRLASQHSFDVLKYDIYNRGVPTTPGTAKSVAYRLVDAAGQTRHQFTRFISETVTHISEDTERKHEHASVTVLQSSFRAEVPTITEQMINV
jgi:hypothetical protein